MSVITKVIVGKKIPYTPLAAWVVADYLEETAVVCVEQQGGEYLPPPIERLIGHLYNAVDEDLSKETFMMYWERSQLHSSLTAKEKRCTRQLISRTLSRFWE